MTLREAWEENAARWAAWARTPGHDTYGQTNARRFLELVPAPGRSTIDLGCGEGRLGRDLVALGHSVIALDASPTLIGLAATHGECPLAAVLADAACLPLSDGAADLVVAFMSLMDIDDMDGAVRESARVLRPGGRLCLAVVHPMNSAGRFEGEPQDRNAPFVISQSYTEPRRYRDEAERNGLHMTFVSDHRPIEAYRWALEAAGFAIEALREVTSDDPNDHWTRVPMFLHMRAVRVRVGAAGAN
jgi:SAM-dependent methyltransferase